MGNPNPAIAIVGMACRFPGASSTDEFWKLLHEGRDVVGEITRERWSTDYYFHPNPKEPGKSYTWSAGLLDGIDRFDAQFFGISPREAMQMDPQQRLLLELAWEAVEDGGQLPERLSGSDCAVFIGMSSTDYMYRRAGDPASGDAYFVTGNAASIAANRLSYWFNLHGPSMAVDTACSSSLIALHQACQSLRHGEASLALVGGVNLLLSPFQYIGFSKASMLSKTGRCRAFDAAADGYVRAEGGAVILLKPLERAEEDGDPIHAVILSSAVNTDGRTYGISLPSAAVQQRVLRSAYDRSGVDVRRIAYVEAHGTGTPAGDPQEAGALGQAIGATRARHDPLLIGSVKTNLGHLEAVSGLAGLIKVVLALEHKMIPASLHFATPNPRIDFETLNLKVVTENTPLPERAELAVMGVSSFGFGGANAHVVLREHRRRQTQTEMPADALPPLFLSAHTDASLKQMAAAYRDRLREQNQSDAYATFRTAATRRHGHPARLAVLGDEPGDVARRLDAFCQGVASAGLIRGSVVTRRARLALVFSGNGCQWPGMGRRLLDADPVFATWVRRVDAIVAPLAGFSIVDELCAAPEGSRLHLTEIAQPLLFALQVGLFETLLANGLSPEAVVGHSVGEIAAAYAAGALTLEQAARVVFERSRAQSRTRGLGRMAAVGLSVSDAELELSSHRSSIEIAAVNSPASVTLSGSLDELLALKSGLDLRGVFFHLLDLEYPFHSRAMDGAKAMLLDALADLAPRATRIPFVSSTTGTVLRGEDVGPAYWWANIREPVRFDAAVAALAAIHFNVFMEVGPHPVLQGYMREILKTLPGPGRVVPTLDRTCDEKTRVAEAVATTYVMGCPIDFTRMFPQRGPCATLPPYPWEREPYWYPTTSEAVELLMRRREHPLLGYRLASVDGVWENDIDAERIPYLRDHVMDGAIVFPATAFVEMALAASMAHFGGSTHEVEALEIRSPLMLADGEARSVRFHLSPDDGSFTIQSRVRLSLDPWTVNVAGRLLHGAPVRSGARVAARSPTEGQVRIDAERHYRDVEKRRLQYGRSFRGVSEVWADGGSAVARIVAPPGVASELDGYHVHPCLSDAACQSLFDILDVQKRAGTYLPSSVERVVYYGTVGARFACHADVDRAEDQSVIGRFQIVDDTGNVCVELSGVRFARLHHASTRRDTCGLYEYRAEPAPSDTPNDTLTERRRFLLLADEQGDSWKLTGAIAALLQTEGHEIVLAVGGREFERRGERVFALSAQADDDFHRLCTILRDEDRVCDEIVNLLGFTFQPDSVDTDVVAVQDSRCLSVVHLLQAITATWATAPRLWVITAGATALEPDSTSPPMSEPIPSQAALWGVCRVVMNEHPSVRCRLIDLQSSDEDSVAHRLAQEFRRPDREDEVILAGDTRYAMRLQEMTLAGWHNRPALRTKDDPIRLIIGIPKSPRNLQWRHEARRAPGPGELEIRVHATGLNYRDVMYATGMLSDEALENGFAGSALGLECAGRVERVGRDVTTFDVGDSVVGFAPASFGSHVMTPAWAVARRRPEWTDEEAATIPVAFFTAYYALAHVARLEAREKVLIHGGAGAVGLAAVQYAQFRDAEVFATAGSDEKRDFLRAMGVAHVLDSRTLAFADEVRRITGGTGVDVVLNSLSGEAIRRGLAMLRPFGRFLELGKRDYYENTKIGIRPFRNNVSYFGIDIDQLLRERPLLARRIFGELLELFEQKALRPLPHRVFHASRMEDAFRHMQTSKHIGKVVVSGFDDISTADRPVPARDRLSLSPERTYMISGGLSGFGLATARWMVQKGARHLALIGRRGVSTAEARDGTAEIEASGATVHVLKADVANAAELADAFRQLERIAPPLGGVVHAAAVIENALIRRLSVDHFRRVLRPKILGASNLDRLTRGMNLEFFVLYSSVAAWVGTPGQAGYVAGNAYLESLARARRRRGLPALAIAWGPISDVGYLAREQSDRTRLMAKLGGRDLTSEQALSVLEALLVADRTSVAVMNLDWAAVRKVLPSAGSPRFSCLDSREDDIATAAGMDEEAREALARIAQPELLSMPELERAVATVLSREVGRVLQMPVDKLDTSRSVHDLGFDSLMAVELETALHQRFGLNLSIIELVEAVTLDQMATRIARRLAGARSGSRIQDRAPGESSFPATVG